MNNPCKYCPRKGCGIYHDVCPEYQEWKKQYDEAKAKLHEQKQLCKKYIIKDCTFKSRGNNVFKSPKKERH